MGRLIIKCDNATLMDKKKLAEVVLQAADGFTCKVGSA
jgi:hypothetical protein